ncbi:4'-phosphopantetheinyl transferase family protein [Mucilaginibacter aquariorum]|uniref:4'-phosphopantetheinyl transferase superfamily protein n=1 Tax=Mucilaginibacter aquariorum TaxID=2967225 RepID=A0ABT1T337_9SPHI|nr:4'-phosphopantetheinyl transferase superfamily protein [Mucilaginibacter aquariorum]MCQ6959020.1 4'-phosphopantetheinyl transferase superfamily protein [Mucilaginibacter aquariorum]
MGKIDNRYLSNVNWQKALPGLAINISEVHIWRINIRQNLSLLNQFKALFNVAELVRAGKYLQRKDHDRFIVSRGAQRIILGRYLSTPPEQLEFVLGDNKKPHLFGKDGNSLHYNLSHSGDWIVLAVASSQVGTDIEFIDDAFKFQDILLDNFSKEEAAYINQENSTERFFTLWTRKEAILKATGQGLGEHLQITPVLNGDHPLHSTLTGADKNWVSNSFNIQHGYIGSVAVDDAGQSFKFFDADLT